MRKEARVPREGCAAMRITAEGFVHYEVRASVRPRGRRSGVERRSVQGLVSKQQAAARPKRASTTMLDTCMERIETCEKHATERHGPRCRCQKRDFLKEERVLLLVYLLVEVHVVDPSINWVLLGSDGAQIYT